MRSSSIPLVSHTFSSFFAGILCLLTLSRLCFSHRVFTKVMMQFVSAFPKEQDLAMLLTMLASFRLVRSALARFEANSPPPTGSRNSSCALCFAAQCVKPVGVLAGECLGIVRSYSLLELFD